MKWFNSKFSKGLLVPAVFLFFSCQKKTGETERLSIPSQVIQTPGANAKIFIDENGIPYIESDTLEQGVFALGYIMARSRYTQIDLLRVISTAAVSSILDIEEARKVDSLTARRLVNLQTGELVTKKQVELIEKENPKLAGVFQAFVDGINFYIKRLEDRDEILPPEYESVLAVRNPQNNKGKFYFSPQDILAMARFLEWYLTGESDIAFDRLMSKIKRRIGESLFPTFQKILTSQAGIDIFTLPAPSYSQFVYANFLFFPLERAKVGSNNWVISATLTSTGKPIVANDPHLPLINPPLWFPYKAKMGGLYIEGFALIGIPGILIGTNGAVAWGATNPGFDSLDLYEEEIKADPSCQSGFKFVHNLSDTQDDECVKLSDVSIGSKTRGKVKVYYCTKHGSILGKVDEVLSGVIPEEPKLEDGEKYVLFRWTGMEISREVLYFLNILESRTVDDFMKAISGFEVAMINFVFADLSGDIGYGTFGLIPSRDWDKHSYPPISILPTDGCCDWRSWIPKERFPHSKNSPKGFFVTANNDLPGYTKDGDPFNDEIYLFWSYDPGYRIAEITYKIQEKINQKSKISFEDVRKIQEDTVSFWTRKVFPFIKQKLQEKSDNMNKVEKEALSILQDWDMTCKSGYKLEDLEELRFSEVSDESLRKNSSGCTIFWVFVSRLIKNSFYDEFEYYNLGDSFSSLVEDFAIKHIYFYVKGEQQLDFFDDIRTTNKIETDSEIILNSFQEAVSYLSSQISPVPAEWLWGKIGKMKLYHFISQANLAIFDMGPFPIDLGPISPAVAWVNLLHDKISEGFIMTGGPSLRMIATPDESKFKVSFALPGGINGFGQKNGEKILKKPHKESHFTDLLPTFFGESYVSFGDKFTNVLILSGAKSEQ